MSGIAQDIADLVRFQLNDTDASAYRWTDDELVVYINAAIRAVSALVPEAGSLNQGITSLNYTETLGFAGSGFNLDSVDGDGDAIFPEANRFFEVRNICYAIGPAQRGASLSFVEADILHLLDPEWRTACPYTEDEALERMLAGTYYQSIVYDAQRPRVGYVYPIGSTFDDALDEIPAISITYSRVPAPVDTLADDVPFPTRVYYNALTNYVCHLALAKEGREKQVEASKLRHDMFMQDLGLEVSSQKKVRPVRPPNEAGE